MAKGIRKKTTCSNESRESKPKNNNDFEAAAAVKKEKLKFIAVMTNAEFILPTPLRITS